MVGISGAASVVYSGLNKPVTETGRNIRKPVETKVEIAEETAIKAVSGEKTDNVKGMTDSKFIADILDRNGGMKYGDGMQSNSYSIA